MSEKKVIENVKPETAKENIAVKSPAEPIKETSAKKVIVQDQMDCIRRAIKDGKSFTLFRKDYEKNGKTYVSYSVFLILEGLKRSMFYEVQLLPDIGFIGKKDEGIRTGRNASSYKLLNWLYANGNGLKLIARIKKENDIEKVEYYAFAVDEFGMSADCLLKPRTPGEEGYLRAAFGGFGRCRDVVDTDFDKIPGLLAAFEKVVDPEDIEIDADFE